MALIKYIKENSDIYVYIYITFIQRRKLLLSVKTFADKIKHKNLKTRLLNCQQEWKKNNNLGKNQGVTKMSQEKED